MDRLRVTSEKESDELFDKYYDDCRNFAKSINDPEYSEKNINAAVLSNFLTQTIYVFRRYTSNVFLFNQNNYNDLQLLHSCITNMSHVVTIFSSKPKFSKTLTFSNKYVDEFLAEISSFMRLILTSPAVYNICESANLYKKLQDSQSSAVNSITINVETVSMACIDALLSVCLRITDILKKLGQNLNIQSMTWSISNFVSLLIHESSTYNIRSMVLHILADVVDLVDESISSKFIVELFTILPAEDARDLTLWDHALFEPVSAFSSRIFKYRETIYAFTNRLERSNIVRQICLQAISGHAKDISTAVSNIKIGLKPIEQMEAAKASSNVMFDVVNNATLQVNDAVESCPSFEEKNYATVDGAEIEFKSHPGFKYVRKLAADTVETAKTALLNCPLGDFITFLTNSLNFIQLKDQIYVTDEEGVACVERNADTIACIRSLLSEDVMANCPEFIKFILDAKNYSTSHETLEIANTIADCDFCNNFTVVNETPDKDSAVIDNSNILHIYSSLYFYVKAMFEKHFRGRDGVSGSKWDQEIVDVVSALARRTLMYYSSPQRASTLPSEILFTITSLILLCIRHGYSETERFPSIMAALLKKAPNKFILDKTLELILTDEPTDIERDYRVIANIILEYVLGYPPDTGYDIRTQGIMTPPEIALAALKLISAQSCIIQQQQPIYVSNEQQMSPIYCAPVVSPTDGYAIQQQEKTVESNVSYKLGFIPIKALNMLTKMCIGVNTLTRFGTDISKDDDTTQSENAAKLAPTSTLLANLLLQSHAHYDLLANAYPIVSDPGRVYDWHHLQLWQEMLLESIDDFVAMVSSLPVEISSHLDKIYIQSTIHAISAVIIPLMRRLNINGRVGKTLATTYKLYYSLGLVAPPPAETLNAMIDIESQNNTKDPSIINGQIQSSNSKLFGYNDDDTTKAEITETYGLESEYMKEYDTGCTQGAISSSILAGATAASWLSAWIPTIYIVHPEPYVRSAAILFVTQALAAAPQMFTRFVSYEDPITHRKDQISILEMLIISVIDGTRGNITEERYSSLFSGIADASKDQEKNFSARILCPSTLKFIKLLANNEKFFATYITRTTAEEVSLLNKELEIIKQQDDILNFNSEKQTKASKKYKKIMSSDAFGAKYTNNLWQWYFGIARSMIFTNPNTLDILNEVGILNE